MVDGPALGALLAEMDVPVLVLNACRSAHAEAQEAPPQSPPEAGGEEESPSPVTSRRDAGGRAVQF